MNICVDARMFHASGIGTYLQNLLPSLAETFNLILIGNREEIKIRNVDIISTNLPVYSIQDLLRFSQLIPKCDIFWSPHYNVPLLPIKAKKRLVTIHDIFHLAFFKTLSLKQKIYAKLLLNAAVKRSDHIITVSEFSKSEIINYLKVNPDKITVIPNGVNHVQFRVMHDLEIRKAVQTHYQLPPRFILYVGNVKPHKNLLNLVKAFACVKEQLPEVDLVIVGKKEGFITGDNALFTFLEQDKNLAARVTFTGYVASEDLPVLYNLADLFVFPSLYEGFGLPPLEAMACGCPVLVSDRASMPEICGEHVDYIDPLDLNSLSVKIKEMVNLKKEQRKALTKIGLDIAAYYTWEKSIASHIELISKLCVDSTSS